MSRSANLSGEKVGGKLEQLCGERKKGETGGGGEEEEEEEGGRGGTLQVSKRRVDGAFHLSAALLHAAFRQLMGIFT